MPLTGSDTKDYGTGFLGDLEPSIKRYPYKGKQQFISTLNEEFNRKGGDSTEVMSEWTLFTGIDEETFTRDFLNNTDETHDLNWTSFDISLNLLLGRMLLPPHAVATHVFHQLLLDALRPMGLENALQLLSQATDQRPSGAKQGDGEWARRSRNRPSVVLEVALSQPRSKLTSDVRYWLQSSSQRDGVKIVLTLTINRQKPDITIEKWQLENDRQHYRTQRVTVSMVPTSRSQCTMTRW